jgi:hypothetical protein
MKFPTLSATARSFSAAQPPSSSSSELTAEKRLGVKRSREEKQKGISAQKSFREREPKQRHKFITSPLTFRSASGQLRFLQGESNDELICFFFGGGGTVQGLFSLPLHSSAAFASSHHRLSGEQSSRLRFPTQTAAADRGQNN